jgi:hypothetical protein
MSTTLEVVQPNHEKLLKMKSKILQEIKEATQQSQIYLTKKKMQIMSEI